MRLKTLAAGLILAGLTAMGAQAQTFNLGLEAGANFSNFIGSDVTVNNLQGSRLGFVGGGFLSLNFGKSFAIRPEVLYEQKGGQDINNDTYAFDYFEVPVLLEFSLGTPVINPGILIGPCFSWNTLANVVSSGGSSASINNVNPSDIGIMAGVLVDFDKFFVTGRYELGLDNVIQATNGGSNNNIQNGVITAMVGYSFL